ncbi:MAG: DUF5906 domain-containing protein [Parasphingopyxis sp.]
MTEFAANDPKVGDMPKHRTLVATGLAGRGLVLAVAEAGKKTPKSKWTDPANQIHWDAAKEALAYIGRPEVPVTLGPFDNLMILGGLNDTLIKDYDWDGMGPDAPANFWTDPEARFGYMHKHPAFKAEWDFMIGPDGDGKAAADAWLDGSLIVLTPKNGFHIISKAPRACGFTANTDIFGTKSSGAGALDIRGDNAYAIAPGSATLQEVRKDGSLKSAQGRYRCGRMPPGNGIADHPPKLLAWLLARHAAKPGAGASKAHTAPSGVAALGDVREHAQIGAGGASLAASIDGYKKQNPLDIAARHVFAMRKMQGKANTEAGYVHPYADRERWRNEVWFAWVHMAVRGLGCTAEEAEQVAIALSRLDEELSKGKGATPSRTFDPIGDVEQFEGALTTVPERDEDACTYKAIYKLSNDLGWDSSHAARDKAETEARGLVPAMTARIDAEREAAEAHRKKHIQAIEQGDRTGEHPDAKRLRDKAAEIQRLADAGEDAGAVDVAGVPLLDPTALVPEDLAREMFVFVQNWGGKDAVIDVTDPYSPMPWAKFAETREEQLQMNTGEAKTLGKHLRATPSARITVGRMKFLPGMRPGVVIHEGKRTWNMFTGWPADEYPMMDAQVAAQKCAHILRYIREVAAGGDPAIGEYLVNYLTWKFQNPAGVPGAAVTLCGEEGTGKTAYPSIARAVFGRHAVTFNNAAALYNKFNKKLMMAVVVMLEEATNTGQPKYEEMRKDHITGRSISIEPKGYDAMEIDNHLAFFGTTNKTHAAMVSGKGRREFVHEVKEVWPAHGAEWGQFWTDLEGARGANGRRPGLGEGAIALWQHLRSLDLRGWRPDKDMLETATKARQKKLSEGATPKGFLWHILEQGELPGAPMGADWAAGPVTLDNHGMKTFRGAAEAWRRCQPQAVKVRGDQHMNAQAVGRALSTYLAVQRTKSHNVSTWTFPKLDDAISIFEAAAGAVGSVDR